MPTNPKPTRDPQRISHADPRPRDRRASDRRAAHDATIAKIINPALGRDPAAALSDRQQRYFRSLSLKAAMAIADAALGRFDQARGASIWNSLWNCPQMKQRAQEQLLGYEETALCLPCYRRRAAIKASSNGAIFFAPESGPAR